MPFSHGRENYESCNSEKEVAFIEGAEHGLSYLVDHPNLEERIVKFIKKAINE